MRGLQTVGGPLRRELRAQPVTKILRRYMFAGRPEKVEKKIDSRALPSSPARTRFAPSPTGYLHLGSLRTALFNYLLARATGGQFLLRLEDTDQSRIVGDAEKRLYEDLRWAGLKWDEGPDIGGPYGPYKQSDRLPLYRKHLDELFATGQAYRCFCSPAELDGMKQAALASGDATPSYNGKCSHIAAPESERRAAAGEPHCVRFKSASTPAVTDLVYGKFSPPKGTGREDFIILKRDGFPTYHFANVVDDHLMEITHVIRGAEWLISTPRHVQLYDAFGWKAPLFAHVGLLVDKNRQKLSKRHGDIDIASYRNNDFLPAALLNYCALLGWSPEKSTQGPSEVMHLEEMIKKFHLRFTKGDIRVSNKLPHLNQKHVAMSLASLTPEDLETKVLPGISHAIHGMEKERIDAVAEGSGAGAADPSTASSTMTPIGPMVTAAAAAVSGADGGSAYIRALFELDRNSFVDPKRYVRRNRYLVWTVPEAYYETTILQEMDDVAQLFARAAVEKQQGQQQDPAPGHDDTPLTPAGAIGELQRAVGAVEESSWTKENLEAAIDPLIKTLYFQKSDASPPQKWGYHALRWVLFGLTSGSALVPSMVVLGREETMRRMQQAGSIILRIEGQKAQETRVSNPWIAKQ